MKVSKWYQELMNKSKKARIVTTILCDKCDKACLEKEIYRFSWRYTSKKRKYKTSGRNMTITGYNYLCGKCLEDKSLRKII